MLSPYCSCGCDGDSAALPAAGASRSHRAEVGGAGLGRARDSRDRRRRGRPPARTPTAASPSFLGGVNPPDLAAVPSPTPRVCTQPAGPPTAPYEAFRGTPASGAAQGAPPPSTHPPPPAGRPLLTLGALKPPGVPGDPGGGHHEAVSGCRLIHTAGREHHQDIVTEPKVHRPFPSLRASSLSAPCGSTSTTPQGTIPLPPLALLTALTYITIRQFIFKTPLFPAPEQEADMHR